MKTVFGSVGEIDLLAIGVHPDDIELSCGATVLKHVDLGYKVGLVDLTEGELGSRGNARLRLEESNKAAGILGVEFRVNLGMKDGFFRNDESHIRRLIPIIRQSRPRIVLGNALSDRHPDHGRAAKLISDACFFSGLIRIQIEGTKAYRPDFLYHYIQDHNLVPDFCVDVTGYEEKKMEAIKAFSSQFFNPASGDVATPISSSQFLRFITAKMVAYGRSIGVDYAEGFNVDRTSGVSDLFQLI